METNVKDKNTQGILKVAAMIVILMAVALITVLWMRNDYTSYYVMDEKLIGDKIMLGCELILMVVLLYRSVTDRKYLITIMSFAVAAVTFWIKFMGAAILDIEYIRIDRFSVTMSAILAVSFILITLSTYKKGSDDKFVWLFVAAVASLGAVLSYDLIWMNFFIGLIFFSIYMLADKGKYIILGTGLAAQLILSVGCIFAAENLQFTSIQSVMVCKAMGIENSTVAAILVVISGFVLAMSAVVLFVVKTENTNVRAFYGCVLPVVIGVYILVRFIPAFMGYTMGNVVKYIGIAMCIIFALILNIPKVMGNMKNQVLLVSLIYVAGMITLAGIGIPLTAWYVLMLIMMYVPFILIMFLNDGKLMYPQIVAYIFAIFAPIELLCYRMSAFKLYVKSENIIFVILGVVAYVTLFATVVRCMAKYIKSEKDCTGGQPKLMSLNVIILAVVMVLMPLIVKNWVYSMLSQSELMIANLSASEIPVREIISTAVMTAVTFIVPAMVCIPLGKKQKKEKETI